MAEYTYTGIDRQGKKVTGTLNVQDEAELRASLRAQGIRPIRLMEGAAPAGAVDLNQDVLALFKPKPGEGKVGTSLLATFTRQIQVLVGSGIPIVTALEILGEQSDDGNLKAIVLDIKEKVTAGNFLWESMSKYPKAFPKIYTSMVRAGEASGAMEAVLDRLASFLEASEKLSKQIKSAMFYPIMVSIVGVGVVAGLLTFVIPKFEEMLKSGGQQLPAITQALIDLSHGFRDNLVVIAAGVGMIVYVVNRYIQSEEGRAVYEGMMLKLPIFGPLIQKASIARFTRTLATLLNAGVPLLDAIDICKNTIGNVVIEDAVGAMRREVEQGMSMSSTMSRQDVFPKLTVQMVKVGEATGSLDKMLDRMAKIYEQDVEIMVGGLGKLIEPIILVVLGGTVAVVMVAMYMPVFTMAGAVGGN